MYNERYYPFFAQRKILRNRKVSELYNEEEKFYSNYVRSIYEMNIMNF